MSEISAVSASNNSQAATDSATRVPVQTLGQDDFMKLLVTQLTNQDPLNPMKDTEYIAQMAQFTSLEQSKDMNANIGKLRTDQHLLQANALIGRSVDLQSDTEGGPVIAGVVSAVEMKKGEPLIVVNQTPHALSDVLRIRSI